MKKLSEFTDIHTHNPAAGDDSVINLPSDATAVPACGSYSVGIHPWDTSTATDADLARIDRLATADNVVAIGETGLDALRGAPLPEQERIFMHHAALSERLGKPLIIHAVRTLADIMRLHKQLRPAQQWVIHGFRGNAATARQLAARGIAVSLGKRHNPDVPGAIDPALVYRETDTDYTDA